MLIKEKKKYIKNKKDKEINAGKELKNINNKEDEEDIKRIYKNSYKDKIILKEKEKEKDKEKSIIKSLEKKNKKKSDDDNDSMFYRQKNESLKEIFPFINNGLKRQYKINASEISADFHFQNSQTSISEKNSNTLKNIGENMENSVSNKFSIRNKYKMRRNKEII